MTATAAVPPHDPMWRIMVGLLLGLTFVVVHLALATLLAAAGTTLDAGVI
jgi:hypothetical protein